MPKTTTVYNLSGVLMHDGVWFLSLKDIEHIPVELFFTIQVCEN